MEKNTFDTIIIGAGSVGAVHFNFMVFIRIDGIGQGTESKSIFSANFVF